MAAEASKFSLKKAAFAGAVVGAVVPLLNTLQGEFAGAGTGSIALMMIGGALGGTVLFVFIALVRNALFRS